MKPKIPGLLVVGLLASPMSSHAAIAVAEGFDNVANLAGAGWVQVNDSASPSSGDPYFQGNSGVFTAATGADDSYVASNWPTGFPTISNWLMTPVFTFSGALDVDFLARVAGDGYLDTLEVWLSSSGVSSNVADFNTLLGSYSSSTDQGWAAQSFYALTTAGSQGRVGFRYYVADTIVAGNYLGIDSVTVSTVPLPAAAWLLLSGLGGLGFFGRRKAS